jgi:tetratricopeptide (TPR) repeat protein
MGVLALALALSATDLTAAPDGKADELYAHRESLSDARAAAALWAQALARDARDFEAAWKLARAGYWLGQHLDTDAARAAAFNEGMAAARKAIAARGDRPEGYFWLAATMGGLAEQGGIRSGLKYRSPVRENLEKVLALDPAFQKGSADRALGRWYFKVPGLFGGSRRKSEEHLRKSLTYDPHSTASRVFLAETLDDMGRRAEAIALLQAVLKDPVDPDWAPEDRDFKRQATQLLKDWH